MRFIAGPNQRLLRGPSCAIWLLLGLIGFVVGASAQQRQEPTLAERIQGRVKVSDESGLLRAQLRQLPGELLAEGSNDQPVGLYKVTRYRIEELTPAAPIAAEVDGKPVVLEKAWRVTIIGGPFDVRDAPSIIWIDDEPVGFGAESPDLRSISTVIFDRSLLRTGARLALSYGVDREGRNVLPERINIPRTR